MKVRIIASALLMGIAAASCGSLSSKAGEQYSGLYIQLSSENPSSALMAARFANRAQAQGKKVTLFLNGSAVRLGLNGSRDIPDPVTGKTFVQLLTAFKGNGGALFICPTTMKELGMDPVQARSIFSLAKPDLIFPLLMDRDTQTISW